VDEERLFRICLRRILTATGIGSIRSIPEQRKIREAADEAVFHKVHIFLNWPTLKSYIQCANVGLNRKT